eukprot:2738177-Rhodomonas_salina.1
MQEGNDQRKNERPREREEQRGRVSAEHPTSSHLNRVGWEQVLTARDVNKAIGVPEVESLARELAAQANQGDRATQHIVEAKGMMVVRSFVFVSGVDSE